MNESLCVETSGLFQKLANVNADNPFSQILETIRHNNSDWNPIVAEVDLLGQLLLKSYSYINDDPNDENLRNVVAVIKEVKFLAALCLFIFRNCHIQRCFIQLDTRYGDGHTN